MHRGWLWPVGLAGAVAVLYGAAQIDALAYLPKPVHSEHRNESSCSIERASYGCLGVRFEADARVPTVLGVAFKREPQWIRHKAVIYQLDDPKAPTFRRPIKEIDLMPYPHARYRRRFLSPEMPLEESISFCLCDLDFGRQKDKASFFAQSDWMEDHNHNPIARFDFDVPPLNTP